MTFSKKAMIKSLLRLAAGLALIFFILKYANQNSSKNNNEESTPVPQQSDANSGASSTVATVTPTMSVPATTITAADPQAQADLKILEEILASHNDNDPRMDHELKKLNETTKETFREKYRSLSAEKRNDRGTIVFLLGRNLTTEKDITFLKEVLTEPPCQSLNDCTKAETRGQTEEESEHQGGQAITLAYPQLATLHALDKYLKENPTNPLTEKVKDTISTATHSTIPQVSKAAEAITNR